MSLRLCSALAAIVFALVFSANVSTARGQHKHAAGKRYEWNVTEPDVHISGNTAWIAYANKGSITDAPAPRTSNG